MVVRFEYSKDFKTWVDKIDGKRIEDYTVLGSYDVRQGYNLSETPRASTFSMDVVSSYELAQALLEYRYIKVYRDNDVAFVGQLTDESTRKIETLTGQVLSIKYIHLLSMIEKRKFGADDFSLRYIKADGMMVLDSRNKYRSLVHILVNDYLLKNINVPFVFENKYDMLVTVTDFSVVGNDNIWDVLNQLLREYGFVIRIENLTLKVVDILKDGTEGVELLDGAEISKKQTDEPLTIPRVRYLTTMTEKDAIVYYGRYSFTAGLLWGFHQEADLALKFNEDESKTMQSVANIRHDTGHEKVEVYNNYLKTGFRTYHRGLFLNEGAILTFLSDIETVKADVTYSIYKDSVSPDLLPEGFTQSEEYLKPRYLYEAEQVERFLASLARVKLFKKSEWKFYSKVKMPVDTIVRFKDIPDSTCRIFEVQDTLEMDGGYTYRAFPYPVGNITFVHKEENIAPPTSVYIDRIYAEDLIFIENGAYKKDSWRIYIKTSLNTLYPKASIDGVPHDVKFDGKQGLFYIDVALSDIQLENITVKAKVDEIEETEVIPIYKTETRPVIQEYKYSASSTDPEADSYRLAYKGYKLKFGDYSLGYGDEKWSQQIPVGSQYENMYLWKRTWNYNISEWVYEMLTQIEEEFSLRASTNIYPISRRQVMDTDIILKVIQKGIMGTPVVIASDGTVVKSGYNQWTLTLPSQFAKEKVTVTATLGKRISKVVLNGVVQKDVEPVYLGIHATPPTEAEGKRIIEGDYYLTDTGVPKIRTSNNAWKNVEASDKNFSAMMDRCAKEWLLSGKDINESVAALYGYFGTVYADAISTRELILHKSENGQGGSIQSDNYVPAESGFKIDHSGNSEFINMKARGGKFKDIAISGTSTFDGNIDTDFFRVIKQSRGEALIKFKDNGSSGQHPPVVIDDGVTVKEYMNGVFYFKNPVVFTIEQDDGRGGIASFSNEIVAIALGYRELDYYDGRSVLILRTDGFPWPVVNGRNWENAFKATVLATPKGMFVGSSFGNILGCYGVELPNNMFLGGGNFEVHKGEDYNWRLNKVTGLLKIGCPLMWEENGYWAFHVFKPFYPDVQVLEVNASAYGDRDIFSDTPPIVVEAEDQPGDNLFIKVRTGTVPEFNIKWQVIGRIKRRV